MGGYFLGDNIHRLAGPVGTITLALAALVIIAVFVFAWRDERQLEEQMKLLRGERRARLETI